MNPAETVSALKERSLTLATAESCTGGGVGAAITSVPGASEVYLGGVVSYANEVKMRLLGVPESVLAEHGAVSAECAKAMAQGAAKATGADVAVSTTGVAGPGGGTPEKPVGTVWFGLVQPGQPPQAFHRLFTGDRETIRRQAIAFALSICTSASSTPLREKKVR